MSTTESTGNEVACEGVFSVWLLCVVILLCGEERRTGTRGSHGTSRSGETEWAEHLSARTVTETGDAEHGRHKDFLLPFSGGRAGGAMVRREGQRVGVLLPCFPGAFTGAVPAPFAGGLW